MRDSTIAVKRKVLAPDGAFHALAAATVPHARAQDRPISPVPAQGIALHVVAVVLAFPAVATDTDDCLHIRNKGKSWHP